LINFTHDLASKFKFSRQRKVRRKVYVVLSAAVVVCYTRFIGINLGTWVALYQVHLKLGGDKPAIRL